MPATLKSIDPLFSNRILNHILFWVILVLMTAYHGSLFGGIFDENLTNMVVLLPIQMAAAYLFVYWQIPKLFFTGKWLKFILSLVLAIYLSSAIGRWMFVYIAEPLNDIDGIDESVWEILTDPIYLLKVYTVFVYLPSILLFLIKMTKERFAHESRISALIEEKKTTELNFLKAQMNPHFLFNTLNNIYSLASNGAEQTPEMIMKLSEILDYTIYECKADRVPVLREWELIENYVDLEALRSVKQVDLILKKNIDDETATIAPLILISIVENAFKHGLLARSVTPKIEISLIVEKESLRFKVLNTRDAQEVKSSDESKGIGVVNVQRQLSLQYAQSHTLETLVDDNTYLVNLTIQL